MPKPKPDQVVRHELVLGRVEREMLDTALTAYSANRVMSPVVSLLNDPTGLAAIMLMLEASGITDFLTEAQQKAIVSRIYSTWGEFAADVLDPTISAGGEVAQQAQQVKDSPLAKAMFWYYNYMPNISHVAEYGFNVDVPRP